MSVEARGQADPAVDIHRLLTLSMNSPLSWCSHLEIYLCSHFCYMFWVGLTPGLTQSAHASSTCPLWLMEGALSQSMCTKEHRTQAAVPISWPREETPPEKGTSIEEKAPGDGERNSLVALFSFPNQTLPMTWLLIQVDLPVDFSITWAHMSPLASVTGMGVSLLCNKKCSERKKLLKLSFRLWLYI